MFFDGQAFEVFNAVVRPVSVAVMNVVTRRDSTVMVFPYFDVKPDAFVLEIFPTKIVTDAIELLNRTADD